LANITKSRVVLSKFFIKNKSYF